MESQTPQPKPVMDVAPPKTPATPASSEPPTLKVHAAPVSDAPNETDSEPEDVSSEQSAPDSKEQHKPAATTSTKTPHPVREIVVLTVLVMVILCGLAVLVYINS